MRCLFCESSRERHDTPGAIENVGFFQEASCEMTRLYIFTKLLRHQKNEKIRKLYKFLLSEFHRQFSRFFMFIKYFSEVFNMINLKNKNRFIFSITWSKTQTTLVIFKD